MGWSFAALPCAEGAVAPQILIAPSAVLTNVGAEVHFAVSASGDAPLVYQWQKDRVDLPGQVGAQLLLSGVTPLDIGRYGVVVKGPGGSTNSPLAALALFPGSVPTASTLVVPPAAATNDPVSFSSLTLTKASFVTQEAYGAAFFPTGALWITELRFRPHTVAGHAFTSTLSNFQLNLSTARRLAGGLSSLFSTNRGEDVVTVAEGPITLASQYTGTGAGPKDFDIVFPLARPFLYVPSEGSLLLEMVNRSGASSAVALGGVAVFGDAASRLTGSTASLNSTGSLDTGVDAVQIGYVPVLTPASRPPPPIPAGGGPIQVPWARVAPSHEFASTTLTRGMTRTQERYSAKLFPAGSMRLTGLRFRPDSLKGRAFPQAMADLDIRLSTVRPRGDGLSALFRWNTGPDETLVMSGPVPLASAFSGASGGPKDFDIEILFTTPFVYNPAEGDLLVDIQNRSGAATASPVAGEFIAGNQCARVVGRLADEGGSVDSGADAIELIAEASTEPPPLVWPTPGAGAVVLPWQAGYREETYPSSMLSTWPDAYQVCLPSTHFPRGPLTLTAVRFRPSFPYGSGAFDDAPLDLVVQLSTSLRLSTEPEAVAGNRGGDARRVFSGRALVSSAFSGPTNGLKDFDIRIPFQSPFRYDPGNGSLVVEVFLLSGSYRVAGVSQLLGSDTETRTVTTPMGTSSSSIAVGGVAMELEFDPAVEVGGGGGEPSVDPLGGAVLATPQVPAAAGGVGSATTLSAVGSHVQDLYASGLFPPTPILIRELRWLSAATNGLEIQALAPLLKLSLSVTRRPPALLSPVFAQNTGLAETRVVARPVLLQTGGEQGREIRIPLEQPFLYDPRQGNLLVDLVSFFGAAGIGPVLTAVTPSPDYGRVGGLSTSDSGSVAATVDLIELVYSPSNSADAYPAPLRRGPYLQKAGQTTMTVVWTSADFTPGVLLAGAAPGEWSFALTNSTATNLHSFKLDGLTPGTRYYYACATDTRIDVSGPEYHFTTAPADHPPTRIWAIGDSGTAIYNANPRRVMKGFLADSGPREADVWLMLGDNAYDTGTDATYQSAVFDVFPELLRSTPLWPTIGNHDVVELDPAARLPYLDIFDLPTNGEIGGVPSGTERYYSFDRSNIHFVCLDSETSLSISPTAMLSWLRADLAANTNEWLVAFWHSPPYSHGTHNSDQEDFLIRMREKVVPILESNGVDLILCGHSHNYERSYLLDGHYGLSSTFKPSMARDAGDGSEEGSGPYLKASDGHTGHEGAVYVVAGNAGWTGEGGYGALDHPAMYMGVNELGSLVIDVDGPRLDLRFLRMDGVTADRFTILKGAAPATFHISRMYLGSDLSEIEWKSVPGVTYQVEVATSMDGGGWVKVGAPIVATGATSYWWSYDEPWLSERFYRVSVVP
ncbi:MAG TPA: hypothetical protein DCM86_12095 [Verrucomicrobiales bacterium]|nr:hypothetical protein [Verrucomicrobiales bacterium]